VTQSRIHPFALPDIEPAFLRGDSDRPPKAVMSLRARRELRVRATLLAGDLLACFAAIAVMETLVGRFETRDIGLSLLVLPGFACWALLAGIYRLYAREGASLNRSTFDDLPDLLLLTTLATWLGLVFLVESGLAHPRLRNLIVFWIVFVGSIVAFRVVARAIARRAFAALRERTLVVGAGRVGMLVGRKLAAQPRRGMELVGYLDDSPLDPAPIEHLGGVGALERVVRAHGVERVIIAFSQLPAEREAQLCRRCLDLEVQVDIVPRLFEVVGPRACVQSLDGLPIVSLSPPRLSASARAVKRVLDISVSGVALVLLSPLLLAASIWIKLDTPGPVFFRQERMGFGGARFRIFKFRTMAVDADHRKDEIAHLNKHTESGPRMFKIPDDPRVTPVGRFLRRWSLDELPQLINVLRGEMSLVGPRPLILGEDEHIRGHSRRRLSITPGITGLWQVLGRSDIPFAEMVALDYLYVTNWSLWGDMKLLAQTVPVVLQRRGAY
jgi:exopolysaccharide biosynthesis polyprenyl glycosylphosphotransferase